MQLSAEHDFSCGKTYEIQPETHSQVHFVRGSRCNLGFFAKVQRFPLGFVGVLALSCSPKDRLSADKPSFPRVTTDFRRPHHTR